MRAHAMAVEEFGLIPRLSINPLKFVVDGKPVLELTDADVALAGDLFRFVVVIKSRGICPPLEAVHSDVSKNWD